MAWKLENMRKDPTSKEAYADLFISQITETPKTACLFTIGDARAVEIILEKYKNTQFVVFDYPALIKFLEFAKPANLVKAVPLKYDWESEAEFLKFVEESLQNYNINNMSFDLIIANPPYGSHSSIAKQINKCLIGKFPSVIEVCQPSGFEAFYEYAVNVKEGAVFDDAGVFTMVASFKENKVNKYKSDMDFRLSVDEKEHEFYKAVTDYNEGHKSCFEFIEGIWTDLDRIKDKDLFFAVGFFTPCANTRVGCLSKPKGVAELFNLKKPVEKIWGGFQFESNTCLKNFFNFWYGISNERKNGWTSIAEQRGSIIDMILKCLERAGGSTPGMKKYKKLFPNLDWSHPWTDAEILKELGLSEDFLEKENER